MGIGGIDFEKTAELVYFDREGKPISASEFGTLHRDMDYKVVERTNIPDGHVSTVWLGLDHGFGRGSPPLIFETMIFGGPFTDEYCERYSTLAEARVGHASAVRYVCPIAVNDGSEWHEPNV